MANRDEIIKQNIAFMYGRGEQTAVADPDKFSFAKSHKFDENADAIREFSGEFDFLSPAAPGAAMLADDKELYPSFEHALQASKTPDAEKRKILAGIKEVRELKKMGSKFTENAAQWREVGVAVAEQLLRDKFMRNRQLREKLMATKRRPLIYKNDYGDQFWGINADGKGQNHLGKCLEKVRLQIERGEDLRCWVRDLFRLPVPEDVSVAVLVKRGEEVVQETEVSHKLVLHVGKSPDCDVICDSPTVSRKHALLVADQAQGLILIDLCSANKTFVNGQELAPFAWVVLDKADKVTLGSSSRSYQFMLESGLEERARRRLYERVANPDESKGKSAAAKELTVFVGNLPYSATESDVRAFFEPCGGIASLSVPLDKLSGEGHRGIAFVEFADSAGLTQALMRNGDELQGRPLKIVRQSAERPAGKEGDRKGPPQRKSKDYAASGGDEKSYYMRDPSAPPAAVLAEPAAPPVERSRAEHRADRPEERRRRRRSSSSSSSGSREGRGRAEGGRGRRRHSRSPSLPRERRPRRSAERGSERRSGREAGRRSRSRSRDRDGLRDGGSRRSRRSRSR